MAQPILKISDLPVCGSDTAGLITLGVDNNGASVSIPIGDMLAEAADNVEDALRQLSEAIDAQQQADIQFAELDLNSDWFTDFLTRTAPTICRVIENDVVAGVCVMHSDEGKHQISQWLLTNHLPTADGTISASHSDTGVYAYHRHLGNSRTQFYDSNAQWTPWRQWPEIPEVVQTTGDSTEAVMSQAAVTDIVTTVANAKVSKGDIVHQTGNSTTAIMSQNAVTQAVGVAVATANTKVAKSDIVQSRGQSETAVMSQKAVSEDFAALAMQVGNKIPASQLGQANGVAPLGADGKVSAEYLPQVLEVVQQTGDSTEAVMSQAAVTAALEGKMSGAELLWEMTSTFGLHTYTDVLDLRRGDKVRIEVTHTDPAAEWDSMSIVLGNPAPWGKMSEVSHLTLREDCYIDRGILDESITTVRIQMPGNQPGPECTIRIWRVNALAELAAQVGHKTCKVNAFASALPADNSGNHYTILDAPRDGGGAHYLLFRLLPNRVYGLFAPTAFAISMRDGMFVALDHDGNVIEGVEMAKHTYCASSTDYHRLRMAEGQRTAARGIVALANIPEGVEYLAVQYFGDYTPYKDDVYLVEEALLGKAELTDDDLAEFGNGRMGYEAREQIVTRHNLSDGLLDDLYGDGSGIVRPTTLAAKTDYPYLYFKERLNGGTSEDVINAVKTLLNSANCNDAPEVRLCDDRYSHEARLSIVGDTAYVVFLHGDRDAGTNVIGANNTIEVAVVDLLTMERQGQPIVVASESLPTADNRTFAAVGNANAQLLPDGKTIRVIFVGNDSATELALYYTDFDTETLTATAARPCTLTVGSEAATAFSLAAVKEGIDPRWTWLQFNGEVARYNGRWFCALGSPDADAAILLTTPDMINYTYWRKDEIPSNIPDGLQWEAGCCVFKEPGGAYTLEVATRVARGVKITSYNAATLAYKGARFHECDNSRPGFCMVGPNPYDNNGVAVGSGHWLLVSRDSRSRLCLEDPRNNFACVCQLWSWEYPSMRWWRTIDGHEVYVIAGTQGHSYVKLARIMPTNVTTAKAISAVKTLGKLLLPQDCV